MALSVNDFIPDIKFCFRVGDVRPASGTCPIGGKFIEKSTIDLFSNKRVIIFSLPGAFTPTCSTYQLPGFENNFDEIKKKLLSKFQIENLEIVDTSHKHKKHKFLFYVIKLQKNSLINADFTMYKKNFDKTYSIFVK